MSTQDPSRGERAICACCGNAIRFYGEWLHDRQDYTVEAVDPDETRLVTCETPRPIPTPMTVSG